MFWCPSPRDVIRVSGPDAGTYLHSQVTQDLRPLVVGSSVWALLLQPTGKVEVVLRVTRIGDEEFVLDTDAGFGERMTARLLRFRIRVAAEIEALDWQCCAVRPDADGAVPLDLPGAVVGWGGGVDLLGPDPVPPGCRRATAAELEASRIAAAWPAMGAEVVPGETLPAELGVNDVAVSFTKGCYPGQELVERMDSRGASAPRRLRSVTVPMGTRPGDALMIEGEVAGTVTSVEGTAALAMVKRAAADR